jgi:hypothetical protein
VNDEPQAVLTIANIEKLTLSLGIETVLHYRRDDTLKEGATQMTVGNLAKIMSCINNLVLALMKHANFHNAAHVPEPFAHLVTPFS